MCCCCEFHFCGRQRNKDIEMKILVRVKSSKLQREKAFSGQDKSLKKLITVLKALLSLLVESF